MRIFFVLLFALSGLHADELKKYKKDAESFAKNQNLVALEKSKTTLFECEPFEYSGLSDYTVQETEINTFLKKTGNRSIDFDDALIIERSEKISQNTEKYTNESESEKIEYVQVACQEEDNPFEVILNRSLEVKVNHQPPIFQNMKVCLGHKEKKKVYWQSEAEEEERKLKKRLKSDSSIEKFDVKISKGGAFHDYIVTANWTHRDDARTCNDYRSQTKKLKEEAFEENDLWTESKSNFQSLLNTPQCTLLKIECLDNQDKIISEKNVQRKCWLENITYLCRHQTKSQCQTLGKQNCILYKKNCLQSGNFGCSLWELIYKCPIKVTIHSKKIEGNLFGKNDDDSNHEYEPNMRFSDVTMTLAIFEEMKSELVNSQASDVRTVELFKGKNLQCARNIAHTLVYDCCFSFKGLTNDLKLSKCNADELALGEMRDKGLCHYIGASDEKFLDLWKSSTKHSFCCFKTKLSRVFQEKARDQLGMGWGEPNHPDCRGLLSKELENLDLSKLDLSEAYEKVDDKDLNEKFHSLQEKLTKRIKEELAHDSN